MTELSRSSVDALAQLFTQGHTRAPASWDLDGPLRSGLCWQDGQEVVATPLLLRRGCEVAGNGERVGLLLATEPRFRQPWLAITAARLADLGQRDDLAELCRQIDTLGAAAAALREQITAGDQPAPNPTVELALFGAPADQSAAAPGMQRVLGKTASLVEGGQGRAVDS